MNCKSAYNRFHFLDLSGSGGVGEVSTKGSNEHPIEIGKAVENPADEG